MKFFWTLIFAAHAFAVSRSEIAVRAHSVIQHGSPVTMSDIVDTRGMDAELKEKLTNTSLAAAPDEGEKLEFSSAAISGFFRSAMQSIDNPPRLKIPNRVVIERAAHHWDRANVEAELMKFWQPLCSGCQLEIDRLNMPAGEFANWSLSPKRELPHGGFSVPVEVTKANESVTLWVQGNLIVRRNVPVAKRAIYFGERILEGDIEWAWRDVTFAQDGVPGKDDLVGKRVKSPLRASDIVFAGILEREKALHRGDVARVISGSGGWQVTVSGVAQQDADIGDTVTLRNPKTNRDLTGVVVSKDEVEIR